MVYQFANLTDNEEKIKKINQWSKSCVRCTYSELAMILGDGGDVVEVVKRFPLTSVCFSAAGQLPT